MLTFQTVSYKNIKTKMGNFHTPVLLNEAIEYLNVKPGEKYIDCTLGGGGHGAEIIKLGGVVLGIDQDINAIKHVEQNFQFSIFNFQTKTGDKSSKLILYKGNFANLEEIAKETGFTGVSGVLFDLGVSSHQLESKARGFSFDSDAELDMRMDKDLAVTARDLIKILSKKELYKIFHELGEEEKAWDIAVEIVNQRQRNEIRTCRELAEICRRVIGGRDGVGWTGKRIHPATRVFQALRIQINDELGSLKQGLKGAINVLGNRGRIVAISFHSLEDRIVKNQFKDWQNEKIGQILTEKPITPHENEIEENPRARSAKMRAFRKD